MSLSTGHDKDEGQSQSQSQSQAQATKPNEKPGNENDDENEKEKEKHIQTISDLGTQFQERERKQERKPASTTKLDTVMVDWNAFPVTLPSKNQDQDEKIGSLESLPGVEFRVIGCIDHHADEGFLSSSSSLSPPSSSMPEEFGALEGYQPCVIQPGPGSCMSLVVRELRKRGLWVGSDADADAEASSASVQEATSTNSSSAESVSELISQAEAAKLALAAILIDTANLTAEGRVTDDDREAVAFLEGRIEESRRRQQRPQSWDRNAFYQAILETKQNSLDLLTIPEILDRDYKDWTEEVPAGKDENKPNLKLKLGFCSSVKPVEWIINKAKPSATTNTTTNTTTKENNPHDQSIRNPQAQTFLNELHSFSQSRNLDITVVMTAFNDDNDDSNNNNNDNNKFRRELLLYVPHADADTRAGAGAGTDAASPSPSAIATASRQSAETFASKAVPELGLSSSGVSYSDVLNMDSPEWCRVWEQGDVRKSRKQVAPLLRGVVARL